MRYPHLRRTAAALAAAAMLLPGGAGAAATYLVTDVAEDSNGVNSQGLSSIVPGTPNDTAAPAGLRTMDLLGVRYQTVFDTVVEDGVTTYDVTGVQARLAMTLDPTNSPVPGIIRVVNDVDGCSIFLQYYGGDNADDVPGSGDIRITCEGDLAGGNPANITEGDALDVYWDDSNGEVVWDFTFETGTAVDRYMQAGATFTPTDGHTRANTGVATAPVFDEMDNPTGASFRVGSDLPTE